VRLLLSLLTAAAILVSIVACSDAFLPTVDNMVGSYSARTFTVTDSTGTTDLLKAGATFDVTLGPRGATVGYVYIPAIGSAPELVEEIHGTWTMSEGLILIDQSGGTFLQNMGFFAYERQLYASRSSPSIQVRSLMIKS
jgi:hypothetical protein